MQVVSGAIPLGDAHQRKVRYYRDNVSLREAISWESGVHLLDIEFSSCIISWRGIWCLASADWLFGHETDQGAFAGHHDQGKSGLLQGSNTNWSRWNQTIFVVFTGSTNRERGYRVSGDD